MNSQTILKFLFLSDIFWRCSSILPLKKTSKYDDALTHHNQSGEENLIQVLDVRPAMQVHNAYSKYRQHAGAILRRRYLCYRQLSSADTALDTSTPGRLALIISYSKVGQHMAPRLQAWSPTWHH